MVDDRPLLDGTDRNNESGSRMNTRSNAVTSLVVFGATLTIVLVSLMWLVAILLLPTSLLLLVSARPVYLVAVGSVQFLHLHQLWKSSNHLAFYRWISLPLRRRLVPLVMLVFRLNAIKQEETTMYLPTDDLQLDAFLGKEKEALLMTCRSTVRRKHKEMEELFVEANIERRSLYSETQLKASDVIPLIWEHERRQCKKNNKNVLKEFITRLVVMTVVTDGILDLYYDGGDSSKPIAIQLSVLQGNTLHWLAYFSSELATTKGVWYQGILLSMTRGVLMPSVHFVNGQCHDELTKRQAGFLVAEHTEHARLLELYPWASTERIPEKMVRFAGWEQQSNNQ